MTTSPPERSRSWSEGVPDLEFDLLVQEARFEENLASESPHPLDPGTQSEVVDADNEADFDEPATGQTPGWVVTEYTLSTGIPGRGVVMAATLATVLCAGLDLTVTKGVTYFFDLCFVVICLVSSMGIRRRDLFTAGVLPPLVFGLVVAAVTVHSPAAFVAGAGWAQVFLTGLAAHAGALVAGYAVALATVGARLTANRGSPT